MPHPQIVPRSAFQIANRKLQTENQFAPGSAGNPLNRSEEHTSELQSPCNLVCRLLLEKKKNKLNLRRPTQPTVTPQPSNYFPPAMYPLSSSLSPIASSESYYYTSSFSVLFSVSPSSRP